MKILRGIKGQLRSVFVSSENIELQVNSLGKKRERDLHFNLITWSATVENTDALSIFGR